MRTARRNIYEINYWPGFVDVLGTLLIVTIFTVLISTVTQIYFNDQLEVKRGEISAEQQKNGKGGRQKRHRPHKTNGRFYLFFTKNGKAGQLFRRFREVFLFFPPREKFFDGAICFANLAGIATIRLIQKLS